MASVNLKDAYFQIPIHLKSRKYLRFMWLHRVYQFKVLCFGLSPASQVFTRVFGVVTASLHSKRMRLLRYLNDWLILGVSPESVARSLDLVLSTCLTLNIKVNVNVEKS